MRFATTVLLLTLGGARAFAGAALEDDKAATPVRTTDPAAAPDSLAVAGEKVDYGVDLRIRHVFIPAGMLGWFVGHTPGGTSNTGIGVDFIRRRGTLELQLGFEYEHINVDEGVFIEGGKTVPGDAADYVLSSDRAPESFGWFTFEFTFVNHTPINKYVALRYGGGIGLGILTGGVYRYDVMCGAGATNANPDQACKPGDVAAFAGGGGHTSNDDTGAPETAPLKYNTPPVFPVINVILGVQVKPAKNVVINIEGGIRTLPFIGISGGYFF